MDTPNLKQTISFFGTVPANSNKTLVSKLISGKFRVNKIRAAFPPGVNRLTRLKFFVSPDPDDPTSQAPNGVNLLKQIGQVDYITGDDEVKVLDHHVNTNARNAYVKVYAENDDTFDHTIDAQVTIEFIPESNDETNTN